MFATIEFYDVVLAVHIAAVVIAFGGVFAYPVVIPWAKRTHPEALPALHAMQAVNNEQGLVTAQVGFTAVSGGGGRSHLFQHHYQSTSSVPTTCTSLRPCNCGLPECAERLRESTPT